VLQFKAGVELDSVTEDEVEELEGIELVKAATYEDDTELIEVVFATIGIVEAVVQPPDPSLKHIVGRIAGVFAGTGLEAATYGVDVALKQLVFDATDGVETFVIAVMFGITELAEIVAYADDSTLEVVSARTDIVGAAAHAANPSRRQSVGKIVSKERLAVVVFNKTELAGAEAY